MVGTGYDSIADAYFENYRVDIPRVVKDKVAKFDAIFDDGSELLELGCGNGLPFTKQLANRHGVRRKASMVCWRCTRSSMCHARGMLNYSHRFTHG